MKTLPNGEMIPTRMPVARSSGLPAIVATGGTVKEIVGFAGKSSKTVPAPTLPLADAVPNKSPLASNVSPARGTAPSRC